MDRDTARKLDGCVKNKAMGAKPGDIGGDIQRMKRYTRDCAKTYGALYESKARNTGARAR